MSENLVLCYHAFSESWPAPLSVKPDELRRQLEALLARGYQGATFTEVAKSRGPVRPLVVTFDDAFTSVLELAHPILDDLGIPGTVFVPTDYPDTGRPLAWQGLHMWEGGPYHHELSCMSWDELRGLARDGWEIGAHTCSHPHLTTIDDDQLARELIESRTRCSEELEAPCTSIAYPYGDVDPRVADAAASAGYDAAADLGTRFLVGQPLRWPRVGVYRRDDISRFGLKVSRALRYVRRTGMLDGMASTRRRLARHGRQKGR
jgi:peptidoglycan/xylan/chitin deacetylase (PgdA/CDA1 family)